VRKIFFNLLAIATIFSIREPQKLPDYSFSFKEEESSIGTEDDPEARLNYEINMLADPKTGSIPVNIRQKEIEFAKRLPVKSTLAAKNSRIATYNYELAGPFNVGGRTRAILYDATDVNTIVAGGVSGGIWKSTDGGSSWTRKSSPSIRNSISALAQDIRSGKEDTWYFTTGELVGNSAKAIGAPYRGTGIYKSTDGGESWAVIPSTIDNALPDKFTSQFQYSWRIETNHTNPDQDEVLVAAYGGILRSLNGGDTWDVVLGSKLFGLDPSETDLNEAKSPFYTDLRKTKNGHFFAAMSSVTQTAGTLSKAGGFYFSADGKNWQNITPPGLASYHERTVIGVSADESLVYFLTRGNPDTNSNFLWLYTVSGINNGEISGSWTDLSRNIPAKGGTYGNFDSQGGYNMVVEVHPKNKNVVFLGGTNLYRSTDGFNTTNNTKWIGGYAPKNNGSVYPSHYPDQHKVLFHPSNPDQMISTNDGGIRFSNNCLADSVTYTSLNNGFVTSQFYTITQRKDKDTNEMMGGMQDNGTYLKSAPGENPAWNRILGGDGTYCAISKNAQFHYVSFQQSQIYRLLLDDNYSLKSYARVDPTGGGKSKNQEYLFVNPYLLDPWNSNIMYLSGGDVIWRNENLLLIPAGSQQTTTVGWSKIEDTQLTSGIYSFIEKALDQDIMYAAGFGKNPLIVKINNVSDGTKEAIEVISSNLFPEGGYISCIAINPEDADNFIVIFSNYGVASILMTTDGGNTFEDISGNLEDGADGSGYGPSVRWAEIVPTKSGHTFFVGTSVGLYSTQTLDGSNTIWAKEAEDLIGNAVVTMMDYRDLDGRLLVATHGNGAFSTYLDDFRLLNSSFTPDKNFKVMSSYPNPFQTNTVIEYSIPEDGEVKVDIYDSSGKLITNLLWGPQFAGVNRAVWTGANTAGGSVEPGVYLCKVQYGGQSLTHRLLRIP